MKKIFRALIGAALVAACYAQENEKPSASAMFREAYRIQTRADEARDLFRIDDALALYGVARDAFTNLTRTYPDWLPGDTRFRISYCESQIQSLQKRQQAAPASGDSAAAAAAGVAPPADDGDLEGIKTAARYYLKRGEHEQARAALLRALRRNPDDHTVRILMAMAQCQAGRFRDASFVAKQLIEENDKDADAYLILGTAYFGLGYLAEATAELTKAMECNPRLAEPHVDLAQILLMLEPVDLNAAGYHYREAVRLGANRDRELERQLEVGLVPAVKPDTKPFAVAEPLEQPRVAPSNEAGERKPWFRRIWPTWGKNAKEEPAEKKP